jgi:hypothetical protein
VEGHVELGEPGEVGRIGLGRFAELTARLGEPGQVLGAGVERGFLGRQLVERAAHLEQFGEFRAMQLEVPAEGTRVPGGHPVPDEGAASVLDRDQPHRLEPRDGFPHADPADPERRAQHALGRQQGSGGELAVLDRRLKLLAHLPGRADMQHRAQPGSRSLVRRICHDSSSSSARPVAALSDDP